MSPRMLLSALALLVTLLVAHSAQAIALERCVVADPQDPTLNVREKPRGDLVGRLKNGRAVYVLNEHEVDYGPGWQDGEVNYDPDYRTWSHVAVETGGTLKPIGWVYHRHLDCPSPDIEPGAYPLMFGPEFDSDAYAHRRDGFADSGKYPNRCYYYGDGGNNVSVSDAVLASFEERGFSLASLCLGLISYGVLFDPETGKRLPSYMHANLANIAKLEECEKTAAGRAWESEECIILIEPGGDVASDIFLFDLPDCFKGGLPYSDCVMNYDMETGRKTSKAERQFLKWQGEQIEIMMNEAIAQRVTCKMGDCCTRELDRQWCLDGYSVAETLLEVKSSASPLAQQLDGLTLRTGITVYDISPVFPRGFGYAIGPDGAAGPSANLQSAKLALAQKDRATRAEIEALEDVPAAP